tara:strand:- start:653 stop:829 length:177 start_codon:yes stop_codon:yes gene_type:complete
MENKTENTLHQTGASRRVDLNNLMRKVRDEEKKSKRASVYVSAAALSALAVFGVILTL